MPTFSSLLWPTSERRPCPNGNNGRWKRNGKMAKCFFFLSLSLSLSLALLLLHHLFFFFFFCFFSVSFCMCVCVCVVSITCVQQVSRRCTTTLSNGVVALKSGLRSQSVPLPKSAPEPPTFADTSSPHLLNDSGQTCGPRIIIAIIEL